MAVSSKKKVLKTTKVVSSSSLNDTQKKKTMYVVGSLFSLMFLGILAGVLFYFVTYGELPILLDSSAGNKKDKVEECKTSNKNKLDKACNYNSKGDKGVYVCDNKGKLICSKIAGGSSASVSKLKECKEGNLGEQKMDPSKCSNSTLTKCSAGQTVLRKKDCSCTCVNDPNALYQCEKKISANPLGAYYCDFSYSEFNISTGKYSAEKYVYGYQRTDLAKTYRNDMVNQLYTGIPVNKYKVQGECGETKKLKEEKLTVTYKKMLEKYNTSEWTCTLKSK